MQRVTRAGEVRSLIPMPRDPDHSFSHAALARRLRGWEKGEQRIRLTPRGAEGRDVVIAAKRAATGTDELGGRMCGIEQTVSSSEREALAQTCNVGNSGNDDG